MRTSNSLASIMATAVGERFVLVRYSMVRLSTGKKPEQHRRRDETKRNEARRRRPGGEGRGAEVRKTA